MKSVRHQFKRTLGLALALSALIPAAASARFEFNPAAVPARPSSAPTTQIVLTSDAGSFDWGDAGIGAIAGFGLSIVAFGMTRLRSHALANAGGGRA
jgi:hypothetical protein